MSLTGTSAGCLFPSSSCKEPWRHQEKKLTEPAEAPQVPDIPLARRQAMAEAVSARTGEFGRREDAPSARTGSWEAAGLKCQPLGAAAAPPSSSPSFWEEMLLLPALCLCRAGPRWRQA